MATTKILFAGKPGSSASDGLSNEGDLMRDCPVEFTAENAWSEYVMRLYFEGGDISNWKWKVSDHERQHQLACFRALLSSCHLSPTEKYGPTGWMLSEMLFRVPKYVKSKKKR